MATKITDALVHEQVRGFAAAGWVAGATATNNGVKWRWYRDKANNYVIVGRILTGNKVVDEVGDPDTTKTFSPSEVQRICAMGSQRSTTP